VKRVALFERIRGAIRANPVTALYGPRQCGKTAAARQIAGETGAEYFDLEDPVSQRRLSEPMTALGSLRGLVVIDEVQRQPDLFPVLRVLADRKPLRARFLALGSASPELLCQGLESPAVLRRLWNMLAHYHGQIWNASEVSRSLGESHITVKRHLDLLTGALMVRQLQPWHENLAKRQVKSCKIYLRDSGLLHALLGIPSFRDLEGHPKIGASWKGFAIEEIVRRAGERNCYFWATQSGAELDLLVMAGGQRYGVEVKYSDAPGMTKSMRVAQEDLGLKRLLVVYPGSKSYALDEKTMVVRLESIWSELPIRGGAAGKAS
jgi:predicted AAA+ superfamily ATPase